jgi:hypothetical protein
MPKRTATSQPVDSPTAKRKAIEDSYDYGSPFYNTLLSCIESWTWDDLNRKSVVDDITDTVNELREVYGGQPEKIAESLSARRNLYEYFENGQNELSTFNNAITRFQAVLKGAITRNRVLPAMLSADPTDLRQAVQFCVCRMGSPYHQYY